MTVTQKIITGNDQPQGGEGIVSIAGARGLSAADKLGANNTVSPFPPLLTTQIDNSNANTNSVLNYRLNSDEISFAPVGVNTTGGSNATGVIVSAIAGRSIEVVDYTIVAEKATTVQFLSNTTPLVSGVYFAANGGASASSDGGLMVTTLGQALQISTSSGVLGGHLSYRIV
tara:strand:+ start:1104 stop:1619 length:516 start_codon:yes stop_codon:yes gene_type:complete